MAHSDLRFLRLLARSATYQRLWKARVKQIWADSRVGLGVRPTASAKTPDIRVEKGLLSDILKEGT